MRYICANHLALTHITAMTLKVVSAVLAILGLLLLLFGSWGRFTEAGQLRYDEMAGILPYFAFYIGILLLVVALVMLGIMVFAKGNGP